MAVFIIGMVAAIALALWIGARSSWRGRRLELCDV